MRAAVSLVLLVTGVVAVTAPTAGATATVSTCGPNRAGYLVYANGVTCPTAKRLVTVIGRIRYHKPKVTITGVRGYVCVATYNRRTRKMKAGSCLRRGTRGTGFGWTKGGAQVPLPPGADGPPDVIS